MCMSNNQNFLVGAIGMILVIIIISSFLNVATKLQPDNSEISLWSKTFSDTLNIINNISSVDVFIILFSIGGLYKLFLEPQER